MNKDTSKYKKIVENISSIAQEMNSFIQMNLPIYTSTVNNIIQNKIKDKHEIEFTFDYLLDVAYDDKILVLYKKLARYYYSLDVEGTVFYINSYREMWDSKDEV